MPGKDDAVTRLFVAVWPSEPARESLTETLRAIRAGWLDQASQAGKPDSVRRALENGPWSPDEAKREGLIDAVGFESDALIEAKKLAKAERVSSSYGPKTQGKQGLDVAELVRVIAGSNESSTSRPHPQR